MAFNQQFSSSNLGNLLRKVEEIRRLEGPGDDIDFPDIVVCGDQSSGKSSVLEALAGVQLPRRKTITTRVALRLTLVGDRAVENGQAYALIGKSPTENRTRVEEVDLASLEGMIESLTNEIAGQGDSVNSTETIYLEVVRSDGPTMTLVDLPGISYKNDEIESLTEACFLNRFHENNKHIILLVLTAASDVQSQRSLSVARKVDPNGERTMCALTNVDRAFNKNIGETVKNLSQEAKLGVFPVYNPETKGTLEQKRRAEEEFFTRNTRELNLPPEKWGMMGLGNWLMEKQAPVVEKALRTLRVEVDTRLHATTKTLQELNLPNNERSENLRIIRTIIRSVESRFRTRAGVAAVNRELNIALITNDLYKAFKNEIENDTQKWLRADFIPTVQAHIANHSGQDPLVQLVNAEISLFQTWFQLQEPLEKKCVMLVMKVRQAVKEVLVRLLEDEPEIQDRPALSPFLAEQVDEFLAGQLKKAEEIVQYLAMAETSKRYTADAMFGRLQSKVRKMVARQSLDPGDDDDLADLDPDFIISYSSRAETGGGDADVANVQLNLHAYSKIATRRIVDVIPMQVHLLLVAAVCDDAISSKRGLVVQLLAKLDSASDDKLKEVMSLDPKVEKRRSDLENDVARLKQIQGILGRTAPASP